jgi:hypothetical protein
MRMDRLQRIYFETSAMNHMEGLLSWENAVNTKAYQNLKGRGYYISPLVVIEMLLTKEDDRRERLIFFSQHLFEETLLPSPEELIVNFVKSGCPRNEAEYKLESKGLMAAHWKNICRDTRKTLIYDHKVITGVSNTLRTIGKLLFEFHNHKSIKPSGGEELLSANLNVHQWITKYNLCPKVDREDPGQIQHYSLVVLLVFFIFCAGITLDRQAIEEYWSNLGISELDKRIDYVFTKHPEIVEYGPFHLLAVMIETHTDRTFSRGMLFDCMHTLYAFYSDMFITADDHFKEMRAKLPDDSFIASKIHHVRELEMNWIDRGEGPTPKPWLDRP